ncbi:MAG: nicotinate (nicotinamide) nucleotide adenylyltransferase [Magnetococcales bacterium]|nr:nicotinate (nicotinamide) nucleotide adenylyltransferase [Magnetococcales bacterium]|tara:strand:+ start:461 stop:1117 length:657 start_codon:yes stop_codon:yes gene_type:complete
MKAHKTILLYGGSFNPINASHVQILQRTFKRLNESEKLVDEAWILPSGQNPFKPKEGMADYEHRLNMCKLALEGLGDEFKVSDFESKLQPPFETFLVLSELQKSYPTYQFIWLMGSDNFMHFHTWDNWEDILDNFAVVGVKRECSAHKLNTCPMMQEYAQFLYLEDSSFADLPNIRIVDTGMLSGSSTDIRKSIQQGKALDNVDAKVEAYMHKHQLYR